MTRDEALNAIKDDESVTSSIRTTKLEESNNFRKFTWIARKLTTINGNSTKCVVLRGEDGRLHLAGMEALLDSLTSELGETERTNIAKNMHGVDFYTRYRMDNSGARPRKVWQSFRTEQEVQQYLLQEQMQAQQMQGQPQQMQGQPQFQQGFQQFRG